MITREFMKLALEEANKHFYMYLKEDFDFKRVKLFLIIISTLEHLTKIKVLHYFTGLFSVLPSACLLDWRAVFFSQSKDAGKDEDVKNKSAEQENKGSRAFKKKSEGILRHHLTL